MALIHRWPLTENANDVVGGLNLANNGAVTFSAEGASFNGSNQWLSGTKTMPSQGSLSCWIKCASVGSNMAPFFINLNDTTSYGFLLRAAGSWYNWAGAIATGDLFNTSNYPSSSYVFLCCVGETVSGTGAYVTGYKNASFVSTAGPQKIYNGTTLSIGRYGNYDGSYFHGNVLDSRIYDHKLSQLEIDALLAAGPNGIVKTLVRPIIPTPVILSTMPAALTRGFR